MLYIFAIVPVGRYMPHELPCFSWSGLTISHSRLLNSVLPALLVCCGGVASQLPSCHSVVHHLFTLLFRAPAAKAQLYPTLVAVRYILPGLVRKLLCGLELPKVAYLGLQVAEEAFGDAAVIAVSCPQNGSLFVAERLESRHMSTQ